MHQEKQSPIVQAVLALRDDSDIGDTKAKIEVLRKGDCCTTTNTHTQTSHSFIILSYYILFITPH